MLIDPKEVAKLVNELLSMQLGGRRPVDGPVFTAIVEAIVMSLNQVLEPLLHPVMTVEVDNKLGDKFDSKKFDGWQSLYTGIGKPRPVMVVHDEVAAYDPYEGYDPKDDRVDALMHAMKAEPKLMNTWPAAKGPLTSSTAYRCHNHSCPPRAAISASKAPVCYTCGKFMGPA